MKIHQLTFSLTLAMAICQQISAKTFDLNPENLSKLDYSKSPVFLQFSANTQRTKAQVLDKEDQFNWRGEVAAQATETNELPLISFQPIFSPVRQLRLGAKKQTKYGVDITTGIGAVSQSFDFSGQRQKRVTSIVELGVEFDLGKDFLGKRSKSQLKMNQLDLETQELYESVQLSRVSNRAQQLYWELVANNLKQMIVGKLTQSAQAQLDDIKDRKKSFLADNSDVATYIFQLSERKGLKVQLDYQRTQIEENLIEVLPGLRDQKLHLIMPNVNQSVAQALACIDEISKTRNPKDFTLEDNIIDLSSKKTNFQVELAKSDHKPDIKLITRLQTQGLDNNLGESVQDFSQNNRLGYTIGATINFALGSEKKTRLAKIKANEDSLYARKQLLESQLNKVHSNMKKSVQQLLAILDSQKVSSKALSKKLKYLRKKYKQARISLVELNIEEDRELNTELSIIDTKLAVLNTLFQYFDTFTQTPCIFNKSNSQDQDRS